MRYQGRIISWNADKGYGFVAPAMGGAPVFLHVRDFPDRQYRPLKDARVSYELGSDARGRCCAVNVCLAYEKPAGLELRIDILPALVVLSFVSLLAILAWSGRMPPIVAGAYGLLGLFTFLAYAIDKHAAERGRWRIPERNLLLLGIAGGWPGAVIAQQLLRHKSRKRAFQFAFWFTATLNGCALAWLLSANGRSLRALLDEMI